MQKGKWSTPQSQSFEGLVPFPNAGNVEIQMAVRGVIPKLGMHTGRCRGKGLLTLSVWG